MKPQELYQQWSQFEAMVENKSLSNADKIKLGGEWLKALPPKLLCTSSQLSYDVVHSAMTGRLKDLKEIEDGSTIKTTKEEKRQEPEQGKDGSRKKSVRKDATN